MQCKTVPRLTQQLNLGYTAGAGFMPIYWISKAVIHLLVLTVETTAFTTKKAVYYTVGTRVSVSLLFTHLPCKTMLFARPTSCQVEYC